MIISGLVLAEAVPIWSKLASPAQSQRQLNAQEQSLLMSLLQGTANPEPATSLTPLFDGQFLDFDIPINPGDISQDAIRASSLIGGSAQMYSVSPTTQAGGDLVGSILQGVLPPIGSGLYYAYQDGGRAWYEKGDNVLVMYTNQTIHSFSKKTGQETTWMQDRLAYPPISDPEAYQNYQTNYRAEIVAEANTWVLMEFPSGGLLRVMKPQYATSTAPGSITGLPDILPSYGP